VVKILLSKDASIAVLKGITESTRKMILTLLLKYLLVVKLALINNLANARIAGKLKSMLVS